MSQVNHSLRLIGELVNDQDIAAFAKDNQGRYLWINDAGAAMLGQKPFDVIGQTDFRFFEKSSAEMMLWREANLIYHGESRECDAIARANGIWRRYRSSKHVYSGPDGIRDHIVGFAMNISNGSDPEKLALFKSVHECLQARPQALAAFMSRLCSHRVPEKETAVAN